MVKRSEWKDHDIEELLKKLPKVKDKQTPQEIYASIERKKHKNKVYRTRWITALSTVTVLFILVLLSPALFSNLDQFPLEKGMEGNRGNSSEAQEQGSEAVQSSNEKNNYSFSENSEERRQFATFDKKQERIQRNSVYEEDLVNQQLLTYGLVTNDAITVPVSVLVPESASNDWLEEYKKVSTRLPEQKWGFDDYYPLQGNMEWDSKRNEIVYELPNDNPYSGSSASEYAFIYALQYSFENQNINNIRLVTEDGDTPIFSQVGELSELNLDLKKGTSFYIYSPTDSNRYFVPKEEAFSTISKAIDSMKVAPADYFQAVIPEGVNMSVEQKGKDVVIVTSLNELDLTQYKNQTIMELIEGILLTAKSFGYKYVEFKNIKQSKWNRFDFSAPIKTPISPNKKILQ
jgi:hypothetical protein